MKTLKILITLMLFVIARAYAKQDSLLLVNSTYNNLTSVVDLKTNKTIASISVGVNPHEMVELSGKDLVYVANKGIKYYPGNSLTVIDLNTFKNIKTIWLENNCSPHSIFQYQGNIYFACTVSSKLERYNPTLDKIDWSIKVGNVPHNLLIDKKHNSIYVSNYGDNTISCFNLDTKQATSIPLESTPEPLALAPSGQVWVGTHGGKIYVIDPKTNRLVNNLTLSIGGTITDLQFTTNRQYAVVITTFRNIDKNAKTFAFAKSQLVFIDPNKHIIIKRVNLEGNMGLSLALSADGQLAYVSLPQTNNQPAIQAQSLDTGLKSNLGNQVAIIDLQKMRYLKTVTVGASPAHLIIVNR